MKDKLLDLLICPQCETGFELEVHARENGEIKEGGLTCRGGHAYRIVGYVPRLVPADNYAASFGYEWNRFSRTQLDSANGTRISHERFVACTGIDHAELDGKRVLDAGCGQGRFCEVVANAGGEVVGADLSAAVDAAMTNVGFRPDVHIVQANVYELPFRRESFDVAYSIGVLHHTPDTRRGVEAVARHVKPGGLLGIWVYPRGRFPDWVPRPLWLYKALGRNVSSETMMRFLDGYVPFALRMAHLPGVGNALKKWIFPVSEPPASLGLPRDLAFEWTTLDTFDWFTPHYSWAHGPEEVEGWLRELGLTAVERQPLLVAFRAEKPPRDAPSDT